MTDDELKECIRRAREKAAPGGSMHPWWDVIESAESILAGRPSLDDRATVERLFRQMFPDLPRPK
jgi:hypothetical protein